MSCGRCGRCAACGHRRAIRTTNLLERLERRRTKSLPPRRAGVIAHAFRERAVLKLIYAALIRAAERWRDIRISFIAETEGPGRTGVVS